MLTSYHITLERIKQRWTRIYNNWASETVVKCRMKFAFCALFLTLFGILLGIGLCPSGWRSVIILVSITPIVLWCRFVIILTWHLDQNAFECGILHPSSVCGKLLLSVAFCCRWNREGLRELEDIDQLLIDMKTEANTISDLPLTHQQGCKNPFFAKKKVLQAEQSLSELEFYCKVLKIHLPILMEAAIGWKVPKDIRDLITTCLV